MISMISLESYYFWRSGSSLKNWWLMLVIFCLFEYYILYIIYIYIYIYIYYITVKNASKNLWSLKSSVALKIILTFLVTDTHSFSNNWRLLDTWCWSSYLAILPCLKTFSLACSVFIAKQVNHAMNNYV